MANTPGNERGNATPPPMTAIPVEDHHATLIAMIAAATGITEEAMVGRLLDVYGASIRSSAAREVEVYAVYRATRVHGRFDPATRTLTITGPVLAGQAFKTPSAAARAVIAELRGIPHRTVTARNGWIFWRAITDGTPINGLRAQT